MKNLLKRKRFLNKKMLINSAEKLV